MNKLLITSLVTGAITLITLPFATGKKQSKEDSAEPLEVEKLLDDDSSPLFI